MPQLLPLPSLSTSALRKSLSHSSTLTIAYSFICVVRRHVPSLPLLLRLRRRTRPPLLRRALAVVAALPVAVATPAAESLRLSRNLTLRWLIISMLLVKLLLPTALLPRPTPTRTLA